MPEKSLGERRTQARKRGKTMALKASDIGKTGARSNHATKKSRGVVALNKPGGRSVDIKKPPRAGKKNLDRELAAYRAKVKDEGTDNLKPKLRGLKGRKKAPSRAGVKQKGGPFKRSRLHGG